MFKKVYSLYSALCTQPAFYSQSAVCINFTLSLQFTPDPQSAVCSPQSAFYTDRFQNFILDVIAWKFFSGIATLDDKD